MTACGTFGVRHELIPKSSLKVWVTADCREGFYCYRDDGNDLSCPSGEIIDIDIR